MEKMFPAENETPCAGCTYKKTEFTINVNSVRNAISNAEKIDYGLYEFWFKQKLRL